MKGVVSAALFVLCMLSVSGLARAQEQEEVKVRPVDIYLSGFFGYASSFNTDMTWPGVTAHDVQLNHSGSLGAKLGMWITAPRKTLGIDVGAEIDVTVFNSDAPGGQVVSTNLGLGQLASTLHFHGKYFGVNVLARYPMGVTPDLPNGRWFPYLGVGGGGLRLTYRVPGMDDIGNTAPAFQGIGGVKVFVTKHFAAFVEGKFIHASNSIGFEGGGSLDLTLSSVHGVGGVSIHF